MVNVSLSESFVLKTTLPTLQCGARAKRTLFSHLMSLEATVRKDQGNSKQIVSIFIDMEKAYKLIWTHGILVNLNEIRNEEIMFNLPQNFLKPRSFMERAREMYIPKKKS